MEASVANLTRPGSRAAVVVNGYFGDRLAQMLERYGATVTRVESEWGRACDPAAVARALESGDRDLVAVVHGETSTGVVNPVGEVVRIARGHDALTIVDSVTTLGGVPGRRPDVGRRCVLQLHAEGTRRAVGPGARDVFGARAPAPRAGVAASTWISASCGTTGSDRKYHHTISAPLVFALREALAVVEEEGLETRWDRHRTNHEALVHGLEAQGLSLLPPAGERLWTLNAVRVPDGVDEAAVRRRLLAELRHRDWRRTRSARGPDLAGGVDGVRLDRRQRHVLPGRASRSSSVVPLTPPDLRGTSVAPPSD